MMGRTTRKSREQDKLRKRRQRETARNPVAFEDKTSNDYQNTYGSNNHCDNTDNTFEDFNNSDKNDNAYADNFDNDDNVHNNHSATTITENPETVFLVSQGNSSSSSQISETVQIRKFRNLPALEKNRLRCRQRYKEDEDYRLRKQEQSRNRYWKDEDYRLNSQEQSKSAIKRKYCNDPKYRQSKTESIKKRYCNNANYRNRVKNTSKGKYHDNTVFRQQVKDLSKQKYRDNAQFRNQVKGSSKAKYCGNHQFRTLVKDASKQKYRSDVKFRELVKEASKRKYHTDSEFREKVKLASKLKYSNNDKFRTRIKHLKRLKYSKHVQHRDRLLAQQRQRYAGYLVVRKRKIQSVLNKRKQRKNVESVVKLFRLELQKKPVYVCCVCHKFLWRDQCVICSPDDYITRASDNGAMASHCISSKYLHVCSSNCDKDCSVAQSSRGKLWICYTCHRKLLLGQMPPEAHCNNLELDPIPEELSHINDLERHLLCLRIPFIKMVTLPKGGQKGVIGPCVSVPSDLQESTRTLPRSNIDSQLIKVKLKRKLDYRGHYKYQYVDTKKLKMAIDFLHQNNKFYKDVSLDPSWENPVPVDETGSDEDEENSSSKNNQHGTSNQSEMTNISTKEAESDYEEERLGIPIDTCLQPVDIGQEVLDQYFDQLFCVAPAEKQTPVSMLKEDGNEAMSFPYLYPTGNASFSDQRPVKLTPLRYFHNRLMNADTRFSRDQTYIFYAQYLCELYQVISNVSLALRKCTANDKEGNPLTSKMITDADGLKYVLQSDQGYKFLKPIRGTPPYWQVTMKDLFAMIRQRGIPTWFCTFSAADMRWHETIQTISEQQGIKVNPDNLNWTEKCDVLCSNPVINAMMFNHRLNTFMKYVILSNSHPIGEIDIRFHRIEFQKRGSPHAHCMFWVKKSPKLDKNSDDDICTFIDEYITCEIPDRYEDPELHEIVSSVQTHSKSHSKSCHKKGTECRFNFPRPVSERTFISRPASLTDPSNEKSPQQMVKDAKDVLEALWNVILDPSLDASNVTTETLFERAGISQEQFEKASDIITKKASVVLKRSPSDVWINQYNPTLLRSWNANMDIQYVLDAYSCVVYIISYISKAERELGVVLENTRKESVEGNLDAQQAMKKIGSAYFHQREICVQEAVYRVCGFHLKESNCKVQFIPVGENPVRMSIPLQVIKIRSQNGEEDIWMSSLYDKYKARPEGKDFDAMCYATFCSQFRILSPSQIPKNPTNSIYTLQKNLGYIQKRSRSQPAIVRYPRFAVDRNPELHYQSVLQLFLPHRIDAHLKPEQFQTYQEFYEVGVVRLGSSHALKEVNRIVNENQGLFEKNVDMLDDAQHLIEKVGLLEDAWASIAPESEKDRIECEMEKETLDEDPASDTIIPELSSSVTTTEMNLPKTCYTTQEILPLLRSMNDKQKQVFYFVRQWCLDKANRNNRQPFHLFITGGAGTGKSHLIKCLCYEVHKILSPTTPNPDDEVILLTAPTGTAAFNIGGVTLHNAFSLSKYLTLPYKPLRDDSINKLRSKLQHIQLLIIDEVSMVDKKLFIYVSERLRQIKGTRSFMPFGNVAVIVVGDFYQLPPVKQSNLLKKDQSLPVNLFTDYFRLVELTEIMRQKEDAEFAAMLNRLRVRNKTEPMTLHDVSMLQECEQNFEKNENLHVFPTNKQVNDHNYHMARKVCDVAFTIFARDYKKDVTTGKLECVEEHFQTPSGALPAELFIGVDARVMLTRNLDVEDGLVNGVFGRVQKVLPPKDQNSLQQGIYVLFDSERVGQKARTKTKTANKLLSKCVLIKPISEEFGRSSRIRRQFPLQLAWACTVHKVQGVTTDNITVSMKKIFSPGQGYVALSRCTSLKGLMIKDLNTDNIYCDKSVSIALDRIEGFPLQITENTPLTTDSVSIILHNIQGLFPHLKDLLSNKTVHGYDYICLTETWLKETDNKPLFLDYNFHHKTRSTSYDTSEQLYANLKQQKHGGVGVFHRDKKPFTLVELEINNLEHIAFSIPLLQTVLVVIYRPESIPIHQFKQTLQLLLKDLQRYNSVILIGGFNENTLHSSSPVQTFFEKYGYHQIVSESTTDSGTAIDHIYCKTSLSVKYSIIQTYYSYHNMLSIMLQNNL